MAVAKRRSQERSHKNRTREGPGPKNLCWNKQPPWLAQFTQGRLRGREAGNGNPLQYSCLENPADWGAWWAAVRRVAESWVWLQQLSMHACVGEGNSNPLQCSCLENPKDRGAWWAAVYGVAESRTRLKWLSSSRRKKKHVNRGAKMEPEASLLFMSSGSAHPQASRMYFPLLAK